MDTSLSQRPQLDIPALEDQIVTQMEHASVPGLALAVVNEHDIIYEKGFGSTSVEDNAIAVTPQTLFPIGSVTKPLVGSAIMRLVDEGKLCLDNPIRKYLPDFKLSNESAAKQVTLRMLMSHTAGLPQDFWPFGSCEAEALGEYVKKIVPQYPLVAPPGKVYSYSNPGINIAGHIAEVVSGQAFTDFMRTTMFELLGMQKTTFDPFSRIKCPFAQSHTLLQNRTLCVDHTNYVNAAFNPSGLCKSTATDLAQFAIMQLQQGVIHRRPFLSAQSIAEMRKTQAQLYLAMHEHYGLTFMQKKYKGDNFIGHTGDIGSCGCWLWLNLDTKHAIVLLINYLSSSFAAETLLNTIFDRLLGLSKRPAEFSSIETDTASIEPERACWSHYTGTFLGDMTGLACIEIVDNCLVLDLNDEIWSLTTFEEHLYVGQKSDSQEQVSVGFVPEEEGPVRYLMVQGCPCRRIEYRGSFVVQPEMLQKFVGTYKRLDILHVRVEGNQLMVYSEEDDIEVTCKALNERYFVFSGGVIEFRVDEDGNVPALIGRGHLVFARVQDQDVQEYCSPLCT